MPIEHRTIAETLADEALLAYAQVKTEAESWRVYGPIEHEIVTLTLRGQSAEADAIRDAYNLIAPLVAIRTKRHADAESPFSIPNFYPEGNKVRDDYDAKMAVQFPRLQAFDWALKRADGDLVRLLQFVRQIAPVQSTETTFQGQDERAVA